MMLPRLLDSNLHEVRRLHPVKLSIKENIIPLSTAQMGLIVSETVPDRSYVELFNVNGSCGIFRTKSPQIGYGDKYYNVDLEHAICEVGDWIIPTKIDQEQKTISQALTKVFGYYRGTKWQLGTVSVTGDVIYSETYNNVLSAMNAIIAKVPGSMMSFDFSTTPWTINVVPRGSTVTAEGRLSRNVKTATVTKDFASLCTRIYIEGLGQDGAVGYQDADTISTYGVVEKYLTGSEYTQAQAQLVANHYLSINKNPRYSVSIGLVDLHNITGESLDQIAIGKLFRLVLPDENVTIEENITAISWNDVINTPNVATVNLAQEEQTLITFLQKNGLAEDNNDGYERVYADYTDVPRTIEKKTEEMYTHWRQTDAKIEAEAVRSDEKYLWKTTSLQTADQIVTTAETYADDHCIAKTTSLQTADQIVSTATASAQGYTNTQAQMLQSQIDQQAGMISLVVETTSQGSAIDAAAIMLAISDDTSSVKISATKVDLTGHVSITDLTEWNGASSVPQLSITGSIQATGTLGGNSLSIGNGNFEVNGTYFTPQQLTINGTTYWLLVGF